MLGLKWGRGALMGLCLCLVAGWIPGLAVANDEYEREPIRYSTAAATNPVSRLQEKIDQGKIKLAYHKQHGYLPAVLLELEISLKSQVLVFSKTSLQRQRISPRTPRALYFNDDAYIGYCQYGEVLEVSVADPQLGTVFYALAQEPAERPQFTRQTDSCLQCHGSNLSRNVPGHVLRSVFTDPTGLPILARGSFRIDQTTPLSKRWGGWYVTGTHGPQQHLGNLVVRDKHQPEQLVNAKGQNLTSLKEFCDTGAYLTPHSDLAALMVLEHQADMHNLITKANFQARLALHEEMLLNKELGKPANYRSESTTRRIRGVVEPLLKYMLFCDEIKLTAPLRGTSGFAEEFSQKGPRDKQGRSLRDLDLQRRLFKYPCSYLVYSEAFAALPVVVKEYLWQRMREVLTNADNSRSFAHLSAADRQALTEILLGTVKELPAYWRQ